MTAKLNIIDVVFLGKILSIIARLTIAVTKQYHLLIYLKGREQYLMEINWNLA